MWTGCGGSCTKSLDPRFFCRTAHAGASKGARRDPVMQLPDRVASLMGKAVFRGRKSGEEERDAGAATDPAAESVPPVRRTAGILPGNGVIYPVQRRARRSSDGKRSAAGALHPKVRRGVRQRTPASSGQMPFEPARWTGRPQVLSDRPGQRGSMAVRARHANRDVPFSRNDTGSGDAIPPKRRPFFVHCGRPIWPSAAGQLPTGGPPVPAISWPCHTSWLRRAGHWHRKHSLPAEADRSTD